MNENLMVKSFAYPYPVRSLGENRPWPVNLLRDSQLNHLDLSFAKKPQRRNSIFPKLVEHNFRGISGTEKGSIVESIEMHIDLNKIAVADPGLFAAELGRVTTQKRNVRFYRGSYLKWVIALRTITGLLVPAEEFPDGSATSEAVARASAIVSVLAGSRFFPSWVGPTGDRGVSIEVSDSEGNNFELEIDHDGDIGLMVKKAEHEAKYEQLEIGEVSGLVDHLTNA